MSDAVAATANQVSENTLEPDVQYAGFWVRTAAYMIDALIILVILLGCLAFDMFVAKGELGMFSFHETIEREELEKRSSNIEGGTLEFVKFVETRKDLNGRLAKVLITIETEKSGNSTTTFTKQEVLESDPDYGGKYALIANIILLGSICAYFTFMWSSKHQSSLGGRVMRLRVTDKNLEILTPVHALGRTVAAALSGATFIGFYMIGWTKKKRGLHDMLAKTLVYRVPK